MSENNKAIAQKFVDAVNERNLNAMDELFDPSFVNHNVGLGGTSNLEGYKQNVELVIQAFPDYRITVEDVFADGDKVAGRFTFQGTHKGEFSGIPPTGKVITYTSIGIYRVVDGRIVERWEEIDRLGRLQQMGAIPSGL